MYKFKSNISNKLWKGLVESKPSEAINKDLINHGIKGVNFKADIERMKYVLGGISNTIYNRKERNKEYNNVNYLATLIEDGKIKPVIGGLKKAIPIFKSLKFNFKTSIIPDMFELIVSNHYGKQAQNIYGLNKSGLRYFFDAIIEGINLHSSEETIEDTVPAIDENDPRLLSLSSEDKIWVVSNLDGVLRQFHSSLLDIRAIEQGPTQGSIYVTCKKNDFLLISEDRLNIVLDDLIADSDDRLEDIIEELLPKMEHDYDKFINKDSILSYLTMQGTPVDDINKTIQMSSPSFLVNYVNTESFIVTYGVISMIKEFVDSNSFDYYTDWKDDEWIVYDF